MHGIKIVLRHAALRISGTGEFMVVKGVINLYLDIRNVTSFREREVSESQLLIRDGLQIKRDGSD